MEKIVVVVMHPRDEVRNVLCGRTVELAPYLEHIETARLISQQSDSGLTRCTHHWRARANLPALLVPHLDRGLLEWTGRTEWSTDSYDSRWVVEPVSMNGDPLCVGQMRFTSAVGGKATRVDLELTLAAGGAALRIITANVVSNHFRKLVDAAGRLIAAG
jgi:hypothetical protein